MPVSLMPGTLTLYFAEQSPIVGIEFAVRAERCRHVRFDRLEEIARAGAASARYINSASPFRAVGRETLATRAAAVTPPRPSALAPAAAKSRRCRSLRCGYTSANICPKRASVTTIHQFSHSPTC